MKVKEEYCWAITLAVGGGGKAYSIKYRVFIM